MSIGTHSSCKVEILPLDLSSGEESLQEAVLTAESYFSGAGVDYMVHNAAYDPHVCGFIRHTFYSFA